ncbi:hypothetical protein ACL1JY_003069, partial [Enterobacter asburiae]
MSSNTAKKIPASLSTTNSSSEDSIQTIVNRQSKELIIAFCGPIGSGIKAVRTAFEKNLKDLGYIVHHIHISSLMDVVNKKQLRFSDAYDRYIEKQKQGNFLREKFGYQIMAEAAI